jgi:hypothetical protein
MSRIRKIRQRLEAAEASFRAELVRELAACAAGQNGWLFASRQFLPAQYPKSTPTEVADNLLAEVETIRGLCEKLNQPFGGSLALRFLECCRKWADVSDEHRGCARTIAQKLLAELGKPTEK